MNRVNVARLSALTLALSGCAPRSASLSSRIAINITGTVEVRPVVTAEPATPVVPSSAYAVPAPGNPTAAASTEFHSEWLTPDLVSVFHNTGTLRVTHKDGRLAWEITLPEAQSVHFDGKQLVVEQDTKEFYVSINGELSALPSAPLPVEYESRLHFERVTRQPVQALHRTNSGNLWAIVDGVPSRIKNGRPERERMANAFRGVIEFPKGPVFAIGDDSVDGGAWAPLTPVLEGKEREFPPGALTMGTLLQASNSERTLWSGYGTLWSVYAGEEPFEKTIAIAPTALGLYENRVFVAGLRSDKCGKDATKACQGYCPEYIVRAGDFVLIEIVKDEPVTQNVTIAAPITAMGVEGKRLWVAGRREVLTLDAGKWTIKPCPLELVKAFWSPKPGQMWAVGVGGVAYFDGVNFRRVSGVNGIGTGVGGNSAEDMWIASTAGLYHGTAHPAETTNTVQLSGKSIADAAKWVPTQLSAAAAVAPKVTHFVLPQVAGRPFHPHAASWLGTRLVLSDSQAQMVWQPKEPTKLVWFGKNEGSALCFDCAAQDDQGRSFTIAKGELLAPSAPPVSDAAPNLGRIRAIKQEAGLLWILGTPQDDTATGNDVLLDRPQDSRAIRLASRAAGKYTQYGGLPAAHYLSAGANSPSNVWLAGALARLNGDLTRIPTDLPDGEGIVVHIDNDRMTHFRSPTGTLFAVAAAAPNEAWAVGVAGQLLHITDHVEGFTLPGESTLRGILATGNGELWVVGDHSTLLRHTSRGWESLTSEQIAPDQSLTRVLLGPDGNLWLLGFDGLYRVEREAN